MKIFVTLLFALIAFTAFTSHKQLQWAAIGDSITYMNNHPEASKNRISKGYMTDVTEKLPYIHFTNHGYPGWTAKSMADNIDNIGLEKADIYSVFLGTNDWWTSLPIGNFSDYQKSTGNQTVYGSYRTIINKIRSLNPDALIILLTPLQRTDYVDLNKPTIFIPGDYTAKNGVFLSQYADAIKTIASAEGFKLADLYYNSGVTVKNAVHFRRLRNPQTGEYKNYSYPEYTSIPYHPETDDYPYPEAAMNMVYDGLHPSDKGHALIAKLLVRIMKKY